MGSVDGKCEVVDFLPQRFRDLAQVEQFSDEDLYEMALINQRGEWKEKPDD